MSVFRRHICKEVRRQRWQRKWLNHSLSWCWRNSGGFSELCVKSSWSSQKIVDDCVTCRGDVSGIVQHFIQGSYISWLNKCCEGLLCTRNFLMLLIADIVSWSLHFQWGRDRVHRDDRVANSLKAVCFQSKSHPSLCREYTTTETPMPELSLGRWVRICWAKIPPWCLGKGSIQWKSMASEFLYFQALVHDHTYCFLTK